MLALLASSKHIKYIKTVFEDDFSVSQQLAVVSPSRKTYLLFFESKVCCKIILNSMFLVEII